MGLNDRFLPEEPVTRSHLILQAPSPLHPFTPEQPPPCSSSSFFLPCQRWPTSPRRACLSANPIVLAPATRPAAPATRPAATAASPLPGLAALRKTAAAPP